MFRIYKIQLNIIYKIQLNFPAIQDIFISLSFHTDSRQKFENSASIFYRCTLLHAHEIK